MPISSQPTASIPGRRFRVLETQESRIRECVLQSYRGTESHLGDLERRSHERIPYGRLVPLTPLEHIDFVPDRSPVYVVGKHLASLGLDFFHHEPIPQRYAVASLETTPGTWLHVILKITWCRFLRPQWYDSGGRFIKLIEWVDECLEAAPSHFS